MNKKTGIYIVCGGVVCFTSTISWGSTIGATNEKEMKVLLDEVVRVNDYWSSHNAEASKIDQVVMVGRDAQKFEPKVSEIVASIGIPVSIGEVWTNAFSVNSYIPPIFKEDSLDYAVSAGLAMDL